MTAALNPKMLLPVLGFAAEVPTKGLLLRLLKLVSGLVLTASDSIPEVAATGDAPVDETVDPNLKIGVAENKGAAPAEAERLLLPVMEVKGEVEVMLPVEVTAKVELLDEF